MRCMDCERSAAKLCAYHHQTDNLVSSDELRRLALEEIASHARGIHALHTKRLKPGSAYQNTMVRLGDALRRLELSK